MAMTLRALHVQRKVIGGGARTKRALAHLGNFFEVRVSVRPFERRRGQRSLPSSPTPQSTAPLFK